MIAALAGRSKVYAPVPAELRLHVAADGLRGFADGGLSRPRLVRALRTHWWRHRPVWDRAADRGVHRIAPRHRYLTALVGLAASPPGADRLAASRRFVGRLLDPLAPAPGAWVEKSPDNCAAAGFLQRMYPEMRLTHVIRDGRDVACSFMRVPWAPDDFASALALWERRLLRAHRGTLELPPGRVHPVLLEDLVARERDRCFRALLEFLEIPDEPDLRSFLDRELTPARAHIGRWRLDLPASMHSRADSLYRESVQRLRAAGVTPLPSVEQDGGDRPDPVETSSPSPIDPWSEVRGRAAGATRALGPF